MQDEAEKKRRFVGLCKECGKPMYDTSSIWDDERLYAKERHERCYRQWQKRTGRQCIPTQCWNCKTPLHKDNYVKWGLCRTCYRAQGKNTKITKYSYLCWRCFSLDRKTLVRQKYSLCPQCERIVENESTQNQ